MRALHLSVDNRRVSASRFAVVLAISFLLTVSGRAAEPAAPAAWRELLAERSKLEQRRAELAKENRLDEAMTCGEKCLDACRRLCAMTPPADEQAKLEKIREHSGRLLNWLVSTSMDREDWAAAVRWQRQYADHQELLYGKEDHRAIVERRSINYAELLQRLPKADARQLVEAGRMSSQAKDLEKQGKVEEAMRFTEEVLRIWRRFLRDDDPWVAESLQILGRLHFQQGDFAEAEALWLSAAEAWKQCYGVKSKEYGTNLYDRAWLYTYMGDYVRAEPLARQCLEITKIVAGENHPDYPTSLDLLAVLHMGLGDFARAEPLARQAEEVTKKIRGEHHLDYGFCLRRLGALYMQQGDCARAEPLCRQAVEIIKTAVGEEHPDYAYVINELALVYGGLGESAKAEPLHRQAAEIFKKVYGENHPDYATCLQNLGVLSCQQGDFGRAESLYRQVLEIRKKSLGVNHRDYAIALRLLAVLYRVEGKYAEAEPLARQAVQIVRKHLDVTAGALPQRQQLAVLQMLRADLDSYLILATTSGQYVETAYREVLAWKGSVFRRERQLRVLLDDKALLPLCQQWQRVTADLARQAWATPVASQEAAWRERVAKLSADKERVETELAAKSVAYRQTQRQISLADLQSALPRNAVLIDFLEYGHFLEPGKSAAAKDSWERRLLAFVIRAGHSVEMVQLGPVEPLAEAIGTWRESFGTSARGTAAANTLRDRIWAPLEAKLGNATIVLISPDGALGRLPLGALPGKKPGSYLVEEWTIAVVPVPQLIPDLVREGGRKPPKNLLLVGNVDYEAEQGKGAAETAAKPVKHFGRARAEGLTGFDALAATRGEIATIEKLYRKNFGNEGVTTFEEAAARKEAFVSAARQHRYVHAATHGFFASESQPSALGSLRAGNRLGEMLLRSSEVSGMHPGLLSGLALAGANRAGQIQASGNTAADDGILTAEEIGTLNLDGVQLVVLSACETGLGKAAGGEGLLGLQRAFQSAGAHTVVASLWKVPDQETRSLMERFYENHWQQNQSVLEALRESQLWMLNGRPERGYVRADTPAGKPTKLSPYYWAAFVLSGDWR